MAGLELHRVAKAYGRVEVLRDVDLEVDDGEFVILVGPSGCGKSTLLRMVAGLENITGGEIRIGSRVVNNVPPKERDIAMVFQNYALYPHMTVAANMAFSLMLKKAPKSEIDSKVNRAAEILGLTKLLDRYPRQLSGGQRQRVAMGRAIVRDPQAFLFDEPPPNLAAHAVCPRVGRATRAAAARPPRRAPPHPGPQAAGVQARRDQGPAPAPGHHHRVRDPRPDRGHDHGRQDRGDARRHRGADRGAAGSLRPTRQDRKRV